MNTLSIPTTLSSRTAAAPSFRVADAAWPRRHAPAQWLPAPAAPRPTHLHPQPAARSWQVVPRQSTAEKLVMAVLAGSALVGVSYGFICLLNLVQNWAVFQTGVATLVQ